MTGANDGAATMNKGNDWKNFTNRVGSVFTLTGQSRRKTIGHWFGSMVVALFVTFTATGGANSANADNDEVNAVRQALEWLAIIDNADYPGSFAAMAGIFTTGVRENLWQQRISKVREPLGLVKSRLLDSAKATSDILGAPAGDYFIVQFSTVFESEPAITEAVTMFKLDDGSWRSAGYYVRKSE